MEDYTIDKNDIPDAHVWKEAYKREVAKNRELRIKIESYKTEIKRKDSAIQAFKAWQAKVAKRNYEYWLGNNEFYCNGKLMFGPKGLKKFLFLLLLITTQTILSLLFSIIKTMLNGYFGWEKMEEKVQKTYNSLIKAKENLEHKIFI